MKYNQKYTEEIAREKALKYDSIISFYNENKSMYHAIMVHKWNVFSHMKRPKYESKWTKKMCAAIALKYETRNSFKKNDCAAYTKSVKSGWLDDVTRHMKKKYSKNGYWNATTCAIEALKYDTRKEFCEKCNGGYQEAQKLGILDEICRFMTTIGNRYNRCIYCHEFSDNHVYVGLTYNIEQRERLRDIDVNDPVKIHREKTNLRSIFKQLTDFIDVDEASDLEKKYIKKYEDEGWILLNRNKGGGIGNASWKWTTEKIEEEIVNYPTKNDLITRNDALYRKLLRSKLLDNYYPKKNNHN